MGTALKLTYSDYAAMPDDGYRYQLIEGELVMSPGPLVPHQRLSGVLYEALQSAVRARNSGHVFYAPLDVILTDENVVQPDLLYITRAREVIITREAVCGAPDLCVEILSPSTRELDLQAKRELFLKHGVKELWLVDPEATTVWVWRADVALDRPAQTLYRTETLTTPLLPELKIDLQLVFSVL